MIELGKKYRTRDGREVRIYAVDAKGSEPILCMINEPDVGDWFSRTYPESGRYSGEDCDDLIEVQPEVWHPIFINLCGEASMSSTTYPTKEAAMAHEPVHPIDAWLDPRSGK